VMAAIIPNWYCKIHLPEGRREKIPKPEGPSAPKGRKKHKNAQKTDAAKAGSSRYLTEESEDGTGSGKGMGIWLDCHLVHTAQNYACSSPLFNFRHTFPR
jgi:hypothetical protein